VRATLPPVVFDCDGVLVDSEELAWSAWRETLASHGVTLTAEDVDLMTGHTEPDVYEHVASAAGLPPYGEFSRQLGTAVSRQFDAHLEAFDDAVATVEELDSRGAKLAVASSSRRERLERSLKITGLRGFFDVLVAGDEVSEGKPAPDLFLEVAARLGVSPETCVAVEDTPAGIESARAAGMQVVAVDRGRYDRVELRAAGTIVSHLTPAAILEGGRSWSF
jgi:HAD superfamily hydrolase (TIGR01509 family)